MAITLSHKRTINNFFRDYQREIIIGFCVLLVIFVSLIFPKKSSGELFWLSFFLFFIFPFLAIRFLLKEPLPNFGFSRGDMKKGVIFSAIFIVAFIFLNYLIVLKPEFRNQLTITPGIAHNFWNFLLFQFLVALPLHFFGETFFRGFLQLGMEKKLGKYSLILQALLQSIFFIKGSWIIILLIFLSALAAGVIARQSRSILYSFVSMWIISVSLDIILIRFINQAIL
jgi:membrane protease YdiL (CAAX protease family)